MTIKRNYMDCNDNNILAKLYLFHKNSEKEAGTSFVLFSHSRNSIHERLFAQINQHSTISCTWEYSNM